MGLVGLLLLAGINLVLVVYIRRSRSPYPCVTVNGSTKVIRCSPYELAITAEASPSAKGVVRFSLADDGFWRAEVEPGAKISVAGRPMGRSIRLMDGSSWNAYGISFSFSDAWAPMAQPILKGFLLSRCPLRGGQSKVYPAVRRRDLRRVLVKAPDLAKGASSIAEINGRLEQEFEFMRRAHRQAHLSNQTDLFPEPIEIIESREGPSVLVMERIYGPTLDATLKALARKNSLLDCDTILRFSARFFTALEVLRCAGIVHADLKKRNIVLKRADLGSPCLVDFGSAVDHGGRSFADTKGYMSPEHRVGTLTSRSDVFVAGIILEELMRRVAPPRTGVEDARRQAIFDLIGQMKNMDHNLRPEPGAVLTEIRRLL